MGLLPIYLAEMTQRCNSNKKDVPCTISCSLVYLKHNKMKSVYKAIALYRIYIFYQYCNDY